LNKKEAQEAQYMIQPYLHKFLMIARNENWNLQSISLYSREQEYD